MFGLQFWVLLAFMNLQRMVAWEGLSTNVACTTYAQYLGNLGQVAGNRGGRV